jgi:nitrate reductase alpha subunit
MGWLPSAPHFNRNPIELANEAAKAGATDEAGVGQVHVAEQLKSGALDVAFADPDNPVNWPRNLIVWRGNLIGTSAKGHEYFLKHLLGAQNGVHAGRRRRQRLQGSEVARKRPTGKLDLMVDINFRLNSTGAYSDIILPTATWYEKNDLNTTDMHPFIHPLGEAVSPGWESKSDWQIFKSLAKKFSSLAGKHLGVRKDLVALPMQHDSAFEMAQPFGQVKDWKKGECDPIPGKTMPLIKLVERDFTPDLQQVHRPRPVDDQAGQQRQGHRLEHRPGVRGTQEVQLHGEGAGVSFGMPSLEEDISVCDSVMRMAPETNGEVAHKSWTALSKKTGIDHHHLYAGRHEDKITFRDIQAQPRKIITAPTWSGIESETVSYTAGYTNIHEHIPFRTLTGRAHFYQDHEWFLDFGEGFCTFKPPVDMQAHKKVPARAKGPHLTLSWITPHSKWGIHSTYQDNLRMLNLFRGGPYVWIAEDDAKSVGIQDNDWVEAINANGATVARAVVSQRVPARHGDDVPRPGKERERARLADHRQARRHPQLGHPCHRQAHQHGRRLCATGLQLQLLRHGRLQPRRSGGGAQARGPEHRLAGTPADAGTRSSSAIRSELVRSDGAEVMNFSLARKRERGVQGLTAEVQRLRVSWLGAASQEPRWLTNFVGASGTLQGA